MINFVAVELFRLNLKYFLLILFLFSNLNLVSQNEFNNWYFGFNAAITFNTPDGTPKKIINSKMNTSEGCSAISDSTGNLLFYTDGVSVWNKNNVLINSLNKMKGHYSSTQSALILKQPEFDGLYYIFTVDAGFYTDSINEGLNFSILDLKYNGGTGNLISMNNNLLKNSTEKLTACYHQNGKDIWIISHEWNSNKFVAFLLTKNGIEKTVISSIGAIYSGDSLKTIGYMKASPNGKLIAQVSVNQMFAEIFHFDNSRGTLSNPIMINLNGRTNCYGLEFSPNNSLLYISDPIKSQIMQFKINPYNSDSINTSSQIIANDNFEISALQLAPNGKIYAALRKSNYLACINEPDSIGIKSNYINNAVSLGEVDLNINSYGLPNFLQTKMSFNLEFDHNSFCENDTLIINPKNIPTFSAIYYEWTLPNSTSVKNKILKFPNVKISDSGWYKFKFILNKTTYFDSLYVSVFAKPEGTLSISDLPNNKRLLKVTPNAKFTYLWSTGETSDSIIVSKSGLYWVQIRNENSCMQSIFKQINIITESLNFIGKIDFPKTCVGETSIHKFYIQNISDSKLNITKLEIEKDDGNYKLSNITNSINGHDSIEITLQFKPNNYGIYTNRILIESNENGNLKNYSIDINGVGIAIITVETINAEYSAGQYYFIPVIGSLKCNSNTSVKADFQITLRVNKNYFLPDSCLNCQLTNKFLDADSNYNFTLNIKNYVVSKDKNRITEMAGYTLLGIGNPDSIYISEVTCLSPFVFFEHHNSMIKLTGCVDALRPVKFFTPTSLSINPNPVQNGVLNLKIESEETGIFQIDVFSILGTMIKQRSFFRKRNDPVSNVLIIDISDLPNGLFYINMTSNWQKISLPLIIEN